MIFPFNFLQGITTTTPLLLDLYGNGTAAYSLRKLRAAYAGSAIRVRRLSDNTEQDIGFVSNVLDTASLLTFCSATDGFVVTWYSQIGTSSFNVSQSTALKQPKIVTSGSLNVLNLLASLKFTAASTMFLLTSAGVSPQNGEYLICAVGSTSTTVGNAGIVDQDDQTGTRVAQYIYRNLDTFRNLLFNTAGSFTNVNSPTFSINTQQVMNSSKVGTILAAGINNVNNTSSAFSGTPRTTAVKLTLGANNNGLADFFDGELQEVVIFSGNNSANQTAIITNQNIYYNMPLLDIYPSAATAYSLRKLRTAYAGSAIRVRRSSDNAEQDIGFSGGNLDTSALTTFVGANNGFVTTFYDQSGNFLNAIQTTAVNQPQIVSSGTILTENSKPSLRFNGSYMIISSVLLNSTNLSCYYVTLPKTTYTFGGILTNKATGVDNSNAINFLNNGKIDMVYNGTFAFINQLNVQTSLFQGTALWNTTNITLRTNGVQDGTVAKLGGQVFSTQTWMGSYRQQTTNLGNFSMSEVILYQSDQSANNINIENNLKAYYGT
jgi:hypothetical protein